MQGCLWAIVELADTLFFDWFYDLFLGRSRRRDKSKRGCCAFGCALMITLLLGVLAYILNPFL